MLSVETMDPKQPIFAVVVRETAVELLLQAAGRGIEVICKELCREIV